MRRTLLILAISASLAVSGCSAISGGGNQPAAQGGLCEQNVAAGGRAADGSARTMALDAAIRTCRTLEQWVAAVEKYGAGVVSPDATTYLGARCAEPASGVGGYMLCGLLAQSLAMPTPAPTHKSKHKPKKTAKPKPTPTLEPLAPLAASPYPPVSSAAPVPPASALDQASPAPSGSSPAH